jgi:hypothetical protein
MMLQRIAILLLTVMAVSVTGCRTTKNSSPVAPQQIPAALATTKKPAFPAQFMSGGGSRSPQAMGGLIQSSVPTQSLKAPVAQVPSAEPTPLMVELPPAPMPTTVAKRSLWDRFVGLFFKQEYSADPIVRTEQLIAPLPTTEVIPAALTIKEPAVAIAEKPTAKHLGTWYRETEGVLVALKFTEKRLSVTITTATLEDGKESRVSLTVEGDYTLASDGRVYGVVTNVEAPGTVEDASERPHLLLAAVAAQDEPFAFRTRFDDGQMTLSNLKCADLATVFKDFPTALLAAQGKFKYLATGTLPTVKAVKRTVPAKCKIPSHATLKPEPFRPLPEADKQRSENPIQMLLKPENIRTVMKLVDLVK